MDNHENSNNVSPIQNELSVEVTPNNTLSESLRINLFKSMDIMKILFKRCGVNFEEYLNKNDFLRILDSSIGKGKKFDRPTAEKIFSVIDWNQDERISAYMIYLFIIKI